MGRQFAKAELGPIAKEIDEEGRVPWESVEKMGPLNFFGMQAPRQYGGADIDSISYGQSFLPAFILGKKIIFFGRLQIYIQRQK
jgi:alkylation response protein AidB-like acyl-CoA dehydrogenase